MSAAWDEYLVALENMVSTDDTLEQERRSAEERYRKLERELAAQIRADEHSRRLLRESSSRFQAAVRDLAGKVGVAASASVPAGELIPEPGLPAFIKGKESDIHRARQSLDWLRRFDQRAAEVSTVMHSTPAPPSEAPAEMESPRAARHGFRGQAIALVAGAVVVLLVALLFVVVGS